MKIYSYISALLIAGIALSMLENQIVSVEQDSVIKDMGLPVDDFGLLMVS